LSCLTFKYRCDRRAAPARAVAVFLQRAATPGDRSPYARNL